MKPIIQRKFSDAKEKMKLSPCYTEWELALKSTRMTVISMPTFISQNTKIRIQIDIKKYCDAIKTEK